MSRISVRGGTTQLRRVLAHARDEARRARVGALVFVGDAMEEGIDPLLATAGELALVGVKAFMFQEGGDPRRAPRLHGDRPLDRRRLRAPSTPAPRRGSRRCSRAAAAYAAGGRDGAGGAGGPRRLRPRAAGADARSVTRDAARRRVGNRLPPCRHSSPAFSRSICCCWASADSARLSPASAAKLVRNGGAALVFVIAAVAVAARQFRRRGDARRRRDEPGIVRPEGAARRRSSAPPAWDAAGPGRDGALGDDRDAARPGHRRGERQRARRPLRRDANSIG